MRRLSALFTRRTMLGNGNDCLIRFPKIGVTCTTPIFGWNRPPELATGGFISLAKRVTNNLTGLPTQREPNPDFIRLFQDKGPKFIKLQGVCMWFIWIRIAQSCSERREALGFFLAN